MDKLEVRKIIKQKEHSKEDLEALGRVCLEVQKKIQTLVDNYNAYSNSPDVCPQCVQVLINHGVII